MPRLANEGRQHAETTARRETVESPRDESCICKFDDSFNKNKGKGTEIKHNNVWWQSQGETNGSARGTWIRRKVRVEWESTHNAWIPSMQHGELLSRLPCQYASPSTHVIIVSVCVRVFVSCCYVKHFKLLSQCFECRPGNATRLGWRSQGAASGQRGMLKGANMISSSHKRILEKIQPTRKWEQPSRRISRNEGQRQSKVVGNNKIVLRIYVYSKKKEKLQWLRWKNKIIFCALKKGFKN